MDGEKENELIEIAARWEAICNILDGYEVSDFAMSFGEVREVADLKSYYEHSQKIRRNNG